MKSRMVGAQIWRVRGEECDDTRLLRTALRRVARRLSFWRALRWTLSAGAALLAALAFVLLAHQFGIAGDPRRPALIGVLALAFALATLPAFRSVSLREAARAADAACELGERLATAIEVTAQPASMARLVVRDAARRARDLDIERIPRARLGRAGWLLGTAIAVVAALWVHESLPGPPRSGDPVPLLPAVPRPSDTKTSESRLPSAGAEAAGQTLRDALRGDQGRSALADAVASPNPADSPQASATTHSPAATEATTTTPDQGGAARGPEAKAGWRPSPSTDSGSSHATLANLGVEPGRGTGPGGGDAARGPGSGARSMASATSGTDGPPHVADPAARHDGHAGSSASESEALSAAREGLARIPVTPALRQYVQHYFEELRRTARRGASVAPGLSSQEAR